MSSDGGDSSPVDDARAAAAGADWHLDVPRGEEGEAVKREHEDLLRRLAVNDDGLLESLLGTGLAEAEPSALDGKTLALVRLAGLIALDSAPASYQWGVTAALAAGASDSEVVGVLIALLPVVGTVRVNAAAPEVAAAMGCDIGPAVDG